MSGCLRVCQYSIYSHTSLLSSCCRQFMQMIRSCKCFDISLFREPTYGTFDRLLLWYEPLPVTQRGSCQGRTYAAWPWVVAEGGRPLKISQEAFVDVGNGGHEAGMPILWGVKIGIYAPCILCPDVLIAQAVNRKASNGFIAPRTARHEALHCGLRGAYVTPSLGGGGAVRVRCTAP